MLVQCPKCKTTYKVSDEVIKGTSPAFRCSRCKHTFELETTPTIEPFSAKPPPGNNESIKAPDERELSFTFGAHVDTEESESQNHKKPPPPERQEFSAPFAAEPPQTATRDETAESWSMRVAEETDEKSFTMTAPQPVEQKTVAEPVVAEPAQTSVGADPPSRETAENIVPINEFRDQAASTVPYLTLFGLLVIFFFLTTAYLEAHPKISESMVRKIPLIGPSVLRNSYLKNGVLLKSLRAGYQSIQGNREVLVVSGEAVNENPVVIREVRLLGQLYNREGKAVEQQMIWVGNALSPKIIRGMSAQDIVDLQRLKPLKSFEVPPGDSISFAIVFLRPTKEIKDFSCAVVSAEGET
jgi:predicted Zn finger-like uncharacterized protein